MVHRFSRTELVIGNSGLQRLAQTTVVVFGLGGVGGAAVEALARSGIGKLVLIDYDQVDLTNINRQIIALDSTVGMAKVDVIRGRIHDINPDCEIVTYQEFFDKTTVDRHLKSDYDYVLDAIDTVSSKLDLLEQCYNMKLPVISCMGAGNKLDPTKLTVADISQTHTCPLAKVVRYELRKRGITNGVNTVYSTERAIKNKATTAVETPSASRRSVPGSSSVVPPVAGYIMASVVIQDILNK